MLEDQIEQADKIDNVVSKMVTAHKITDTTSEEVYVIENAVEFLNTHLFNSELSKVKISIIPDKKGSKNRTFGWFCRKIWQNGTEEQCDELNITANSLNRPFNQVFITIIHELIRVYASVHNIQDTSRQGRYHNKRFGDLCKKFDLVTEFNEKFGYITPHDKISSSIEVLLNRFLLTLKGKVDLSHLFKYSRVELLKPKAAPKPKTKYIYTCPNCGNSITFTKEISLKRIICICDTEMECTTETE